MPEQIAKNLRLCERTNVQVDLCYETFGSPDHDPLVLIMGLNGQSVVWDDDFCTKLAENFFVIRFDNRDVGHSTKWDKSAAPSVYAHVLPWWLQWRRTEEPYTLNCLARDVWALVDRAVTPGAKAHLCGISMGGMIAQCATLIHPDRVLSLTSIMSTTNAPDLPGPPFWVKWEMSKKPKSLAIEDRVAFRMHMLENVLAYNQKINRDRHREITRKCVRRTDYMAGFLRQLAAIQRTPSRDPLFQELGPRAPPTLVVHGRGDFLVPLAAGERTAAVIEGAELRVYDDMGHCIDEVHWDRLVSDINNVAQKGRARR